jgi:hypothetical protein
MAPGYRAANDRVLATLQSRLGAEVFAATWLAGSTLTLEAAIAEVLDCSSVVIG